MTNSLGMKEVNAMAKSKSKKKSRKSPARKKKAAKPKPSRDVEKAYTTKQTVAKLRRLADALEKGKRFAIQVAGERVWVPADAVFNIEHEREGKSEEVEFQFKWKRD